MTKKIVAVTYMIDGRRPYIYNAEALEIEARKAC